MGARSILTNHDKNPRRVANAKTTLAAGRARYLKARDERATAVIANALVENKGGDLTTCQVGAIAKTLRRSKEAIRELIEVAREELAANAGFYVQSHKTVVEMALDAGDPKALEVAARASQWAMEKISHDGARVVDAAAAPSGGGQILIGINFKLGGRNPSIIEGEKALPPPLDTPPLPPGSEP